MSDTLNILYFASLGETLGCDEEAYAPAQLPCRLSVLKAELSARGDTWKAAFADDALKCAVNHSIVFDDPQLSADDEIAFFPPVTGG